MQWGLACVGVVLLGCSGGDGAVVDAAGVDASGTDAGVTADGGVTLGPACESASAQMTGPYAFVTGLEVLVAAPESVCTVLPGVAACTQAFTTLRMPTSHCLGETIASTTMCCPATEVTALARQFCGFLPAIMAGMTPANYADIATWNPCLGTSADP